MPLAPGTRLGPYEVTASIGAGGMGEVYKAADTRLGRVVAIKVLPEHLAGDPDRLARFEREARTISSLNHPHICALHDVGEARGTRFLVMEYIDGLALVDRIARGPLPVDDAVAYGLQIADALATAHAHGIVHRDLKPGNVMITASGIKLLDFGLAKFDTEAVGGPAVTKVTTVAGSQPLTGEGTILGTVRYMSPEQLEGREADARTDVYALCAVLYEMLTGRWLFEGRTQASIIAAILKDRPRPLGDFQPLSPPLLDRVVQTGLDKVPDRRWQSARELAHALEWVRSAPSATAPPAATRAAWLWKALAVGLAVALAAVLLVQRPPPSEVERRLEVWTGESANPTGFAISPDGRSLTYVAYGPEGTQLWLRPLDGDKAEALPQTQGASHPFWSPDSQSIGFFAERLLKRIDLVSRVTTSLTAAVSPYGGTWGADGILFTPEPGSTVLLVPASGGEPVPALPPGSRLFPVFLGTGPAFVFRPLLIGEPELHLAGLGSEDSELLLRNAAGAALHPSGYLLFVRQGTLLAQRYDGSAGEVVGPEVAVADSVMTSDFGAGTALSVSPSGLVAYRRGETSRQLAWFDRSGQPAGRSGSQTSDLRWPEISAQGRVAVQKTTGGQLWLTGAGTSAPTQLTFSAEGKLAPIWSPDGRWVAFTAFQDGSLRRKRSDGAGDEEILLPMGAGRSTDWSPDGTWILRDVGSDIELLSLDGDRETRPYLNDATYVEARGVFSPDGRWVAYESDQSGRFEIHVRPFPDPSGGQSKVSSDGGSFARWSADGRELYYLSPAGAMMAVTVDAAGDVFRFDQARELFRTRIAAVEMAELLSPYDVSEDGRFLMRVPGEAALDPITVILNWSPGDR